MGNKDENSLIIRMTQFLTWYWAKLLFYNLNKFIQNLRIFKTNYYT